MVFMLVFVLFIVIMLIDHICEIVFNLYGSIYYQIGFLSDYFDLLFVLSEFAPSYLLLNLHMDFDPDFDNTQIC